MTDITIECTCSSMPNQYEGTVNGKSFYFRARHGGWGLQVNDDPAGRGIDGMYVGQGDEDHAGWWDEPVARAFCLARLNEYATTGSTTNE